MRQKRANIHEEAAVDGVYRRCTNCLHPKPPNRKRQCDRCASHFAKIAQRPEQRLVKLKRGAKNRSYDVMVSDDALLALFEQDCFYCGRPSSADKLNGVDRMDNAKGYVPGNCVPCCGPCNKMKYALDGRTFIERACHVSAHKGGPGAKRAECWGVPTQVYEVAYKKRASKQHWAYELTRDDFKRLTQCACTYCGRPPPASRRHGIDRVDNSKGYVLDNCVAACGDCNIAKLTQTAAEFVDRCKAIAARAPTLWDQLPADMPRNLAMRKKRHQPEREKLCTECSTTTSNHWLGHPADKDKRVCHVCYKRLKRCLDKLPAAAPAAADVNPARATRARATRARATASAANPAVANNPSRATGATAIVTPAARARRVVVATATPNDSDSEPDCASDSEPEYDGSSDDESESDIEYDDHSSPDDTESESESAFDSEDSDDSGDERRSKRAKMDSPKPKPKSLTKATGRSKSLTKAKAAARSKPVTRAAAKLKLKPQPKSKNKPRGS